MKKGYLTLLAEANAVIESCNVTEVNSAQHDSNVLIVDLRETAEILRDGMIPGAFHAPRGLIEFWVDPTSPYHKPVFQEKTHFILYCASGWRSALTAKTLQEMGLPNIKHLEGGFGAWKQSGAPIATKKDPT
ncbi:MAG: rhodanese [Ferrovum sp. 37-45-19]|nr:thiosulfate sulfurtransferase GlpE [Ferrovum sp. JA12]OYV78790.1 MAG: rhodanese [Ferrovum sp. 21-44-67]OYV93904.1 MAG: rhodanese [Ferrovum sp. 37-45-19]OZB32026.1 MAG: rhodanese [Ferrovum sp. 34-44-207]